MRGGERRGKNVCEVKGLGFLVGIGETGDPERAVEAMAIILINYDDFVKDPIL